MMLGASPLPENLGGAAVVGTGQDEVAEFGGGSISGGLVGGGRAEEGDRNFGGNRWPREETLALLRIRSDMDLAFRDSSLKTPLWDEVSRKLGELGFHRTAKKCKEKFENIYKYHKRTKEGRSGRPNGKNYRFFDELEAFDTLSSSHPPPLSPGKTPAAHTVPPPPPLSVMMVEPINTYQEAATTTPHTNTNNILEFVSATSTSTASTSSAREESEGGRKRKKRKLSGFFERLMKEVIEKQENLQRQFIEAIERCENERRAREAAWKMQELAKIEREQEILAQERAIAAAKDAAVIAFLQKISGKASLPEMNPPPTERFAGNPNEIKGNGNGEQYIISHSNNNQILLSLSSAASSRWPKAEVEALIKLRTDLDVQYQENGAKGALWEDISSAMKKLGYDRSSKKCKEKWENINKYFKRVKESNRKRSQDSKTCPYFHQLDAIYRERSTCSTNDTTSNHKRVLLENSNDNNTNTYSSLSVSNPPSGYNNNDSMLKPEEVLMHMVVGRPEEQKQNPVADSAQDADPNQEEEEEETEDDDDLEEDEEEGENGDGYQIVANTNNANNSSMAVM